MYNQSFKYFHSLPATNSANLEKVSVDITVY